MKKILFASSAALAVIAFTLAACGPAKQASGDESLKKIEAAGKLTVGLDDAFPPMGFRDANNEIVGYDVDLAREVASRMGVALALQPIDWNAKEQELNTGKIDCIWNGFTITAEREKAILFSEPYLRNAQVLVVRSGAPYKKLADLAGKSIGLQAGSSAADAVSGAADFKASLKETIEFKDNLTALMDLEAKGVDAVVMDLLVANDNIVRSGKPYAVMEESLAPELYGVGFRLGDAALRNKVQETLKAMAADGTVAKISAKWFGSDISIIGK